MFEEKKRLTFVLPGIINIPMGGVKVVNRLAQLLSKKDYYVTFVYPIKIDMGLLQAIKGSVKKYLDQKNKVDEKLYYQPGSKVNAIIVKEISEKYVPDGDYIVAVGWQTAAAVSSLSARKGEKVYFLQSYEAYFSATNRVLETYRLPLKKIALSNWIIKEMIKLGQKALGPVGNSVNPEEFFIDGKIKKTNDVLMMYHPAKIKNAGFGLKVLSSIKKQNSKFSAILFSARQPVHKIPDWIKVVIRPDIEKLRMLYNMSQVYFSTSKWEGWGLTPMEAMACGCAVVAVRNQGINEYLKNRVNAFVINEKDNRDAVEKITKLINDESQREKFLEESQKTLARYSESEIADRFENCLTEKV